MTDVFTPEKRSEVMSLIKSKWTKPEVKIHNFLKGRKIKHKMHPNIAGNPDVIVHHNNKALFIHGCFWHKCPKCYREPKSNKSYWMPKIENNVKRDRKNAKLVKEQGFSALRVWEHEINKDIEKALRKMIQ